MKKTLTLFLLFLLFLLPACSLNIKKNNEQTNTNNSQPAIPEHLANITPEVNNSNTQANVIVDFDKVITNSPQYHGVNGWWTDQDESLWIERYKELNVNIVRLPVLQFILEPQNDDSDPNHINWEGFGFDKPFELADKSLTYQKWFIALKDLDVTLMLYTPYLANWMSKTPSDNPMMSPFPPADISEYSEFIRALLTYLVEEINYPPDKLILEPINEADLICGADPAVPCFWQDWSEEELINVLVSTNREAEEVSPEIKIAGLSSCCEPDLMNFILENENTQDILDYFTYHDYEYSEEIFINRDFSNYTLNAERPAFINEYGSTLYWSVGEEGAIWHSVYLTELWQTGLSPIQYHMANWPIMHEGYNELGLFYNWLNNWEIKPSYWVYVNFYAQFKQSLLLEAAFPDNSTGLAGKTDEKNSLSIWVNSNQSAVDNFVFQIDNFPSETIQVQVFNNLVSNTPIASFEINKNQGQNNFLFQFPNEKLSSFSFLIIGQ